MTDRGVNLRQPGGDTLLDGVGLGGFRVTGWFEGLGRQGALDLVARELGGALRKRRASIKGYDHAWDVLSGGLVAVSDCPGRDAEVHVQVPQTDAEVLGWRAVRRFLLAFVGAASRWQSSRLDLNVDVQGGVDPREVYAALRAGDVVTRVRSDHMALTENAAGGATCYVGSRESERLLRVYRADVVHLGLEPGTVRWELEQHGEAATSAMQAMFGLGAVPKLPRGLVQAKFWSMVRGFVDFRDSASAVRSNDRTPLDWWAQLTAGVERVARWHIERAELVPRSVSRITSWALRQWAVSLAYLGRELGAERTGQFVEALFIDGDRRLEAQFQRHYGAA